MDASMIPAPIQELLVRQVWDNTVQKYVIAVLFLIALLIVLQLFRTVVLQRIRSLAEKTGVRLFGELIGILQNIGGPFFFFTSLYLASKSLVLPETAQKTLFGLFLIFLVYEGIRILSRILEVSILKFWIVKAREDEQIASMVRLVIKIVLWSLGLLMLLSNLGINVTSLVASLGIGGIAVALAAQNVLGDLFSSFSIYVDEPFKIGDFIVVGEDMGTVKHIGLKTTRIQALRGEELIIPNAELTSTRVQNFKRMQRRRVPFIIGVEYGTPLEKLKSIPVIIKAIIAAQEQVDVDRVHFKEFADSSLNFECVYYINSADYNVYMDTQQAINLGIVEAFEKEGISMAFPTRTVHVVKG